ncbi:hypothetical protein HOY80DRAFT_95617 [Tuber brumale]|nr:hypothetical protein HOY80DRAFT_95617 [Tuber brumale]
MVNIFFSFFVSLWCYLFFFLFFFYCSLFPLLPRFSKARVKMQGQEEKKVSPSQRKEKASYPINQDGSRSFLNWVGASWYGVSCSYTLSLAFHESTTPFPQREEFQKSFMTGPELELVDSIDSFSIYQDDIMSGGSSIDCSRDGTYRTYPPRLYARRLRPCECCTRVVRG